MIRLDARKLQTKTDAHPYLKEMLSFPDYYGNNLDALFDCLTDLGPTQVCMEHTELQGSYYEKILRVFKDAHKANPDLELLTQEQAAKADAQPELDDWTDEEDLKRLDGMTDEAEGWEQADGPADDTDAMKELDGPEEEADETGKPVEL